MHILLDYFQLHPKHLPPLFLRLPHQTKHIKLIKKLNLIIYAKNKKRADRQNILSFASVYIMKIPSSGGVFTQKDCKF